MFISVININDEFITGHLLSKPYHIPYNTERYLGMLELENQASRVTTSQELKPIVEEFEKILSMDSKKLMESNVKNLYYYEGTETFFLKLGDVISTVPMPKVLVDKLLYAYNKNMPVDPIIKFWVRLLRNPNMDDVEQATRKAKLICDYISRTFVSPVLFDQFKEAGFSEDIARQNATVSQTPLTMEGLINTKKVVNPLFDTSVYDFAVDSSGQLVKTIKMEVSKEVDDDFNVILKPSFSEGWIFEPAIMGNRGDAFFCDQTLGHVILVGKEQRLPHWHQVNCDDTVSCAKGLHTGNQDYINSYERDNNVTLNCFVDPSNIGAVSDGENVFRVLALFPHSIKDRETENKNLYHSSTYAALNDERWKVNLEEALSRFSVKISEFERRMNELKAL